MARVTKLDNEVVTIFCPECTCCLADSTHCAICHTTRPMAILCGCFDDECESKLKDYVAREKARLTKLAIDRKARTTLNV